LSYRGIALINFDSTTVRGNFANFLALLASLRPAAKSLFGKMREQLVKATSGKHFVSISEVGISSVS
jgi:hypothetical protein